MNITPLGSFLVARQGIPKLNPSSNRLKDLDVISQPQSNIIPLHFGKSLGQKDQGPMYDVAIVGGGLAGLTAAWLIQNQSPNIQNAVLLEQTDRFGGNGKSGHMQAGERGFDYPRGASLWTSGSPWHTQLLTSLGIHPTDPEYSVAPYHAYVPSPQHGMVWSSTDSVENLRQSGPDSFQYGFSQLVEWTEDQLKALIGKKAYPLTDARSKALRMDNQSFAQVLDDLYGRIPDILPVIQQLKKAAEGYFRMVLRSDLGAEAEELSALGAALDLVENTGAQQVFPGGNQFVMDKIIQQLQEAQSKGQGKIIAKTKTHVLSVLEDEDGVRVTYKNEAGHIQTLRAKTALLGIPLDQLAELPGLPIQPEQRTLFQAIPHCSYALMNVILKPNSHLNTLAPNTYSILTQSELVSDFVLTHTPDDAFSVVTCYIPLTSERKNKLRWENTASDKEALQAKALEELLAAKPEIKSSIDRVELNFYDYGMAGAKPGQLSKLKDISPKLGDRIFIIHSDMSGTPVVRGALDQAKQGVDLATQHLSQEIPVLSLLA